LRIYPAFWVALALIVALTSEEFRDLGGAITTSLLIHIHWPTHVIGPMPQAWSLATEVSFYAALPLAARFLRPWLRSRDRDARRNGLFLFCGLAYLLSVFFRIWVYGLDNRWTGAAVLWLPGMLDFFAIGMALAVARVGFEPGTTARGIVDRVARAAGWWWLLAAVLFHVVSQRMGLALGLDVASWPREMGRQFMYGAIGFCLLFPLVFGDGRSVVRGLVRSRPMEWLGTISYSIYLWHMVFIVHPWGPMTDLFGEVREFDTPYWRLCLVAGIPVLVVATVSYYVVERAGLRLQGRVRRPVHDPTGGEAWVAARLAQWRARSFRVQLGVIAALGLVLRVVYIVAAKRDQTLATTDVFPGDQFYYSRAADALAEGEGFVTPWHDISVELGLVPLDSVPAHAADHPPLTAIVAAPASFLPGGRGEHLFEQLFVMAVVGAAVIVMIGLLGREVANRTVGLVAAALAALYPGFWINDGLVMAESLTTLLVAGALWAAFRYRREPSARVAGERGLWIGLAGLARAESLLLGLLVAVPVMWAAHRDWAARVRRTAVVAVVAVVAITPWVVPNLVRFDEPVVMSTNDGQTLIGANSPQTYEGDAIGFWSLEYQQELAPGIPELEGADASVRSRIWRDEAFDFIGDHLGDQPRVMGARLGRLWGVYRPLQMAVWNTGEGREVWASNLAFVSFWVLAPLGAVGWWRLGRGSTRRAGRWPLTAMSLHVSIVGAAFYGIPRFRVPADVAFVVCAAIGIRWLASLGTCRPRPTSSSPSSSS
jgi:peptidoglycan/LPS O-acetylase OafA/YrhL/4-amino-4-deoxy-L-arabinose transferase-like glycosyltransferase